MGIQWVELVPDVKLNFEQTTPLRRCPVPPPLAVKETQCRPACRVITILMPLIMNIVG